MPAAKDLIERRVPQYLAVYLGASWALVEFMAFLEDRLLLSPHWTNLVLLVVALLLPSVALFVYFHGRPGQDRWHRLEKLAIPANVLVMLMVLFIVFSGKDLGAVTTTVTVEDEDGNAIERVVPKSEFRRRVAFFPLDVDTAGAHAWLAEGVMDALTMDLFQEMFLDMREPAHFQEELREAGFADGRNVPGSLKRRIAQDLHLGYFVDGTVQTGDEGYRCALSLHDAARGRVIAEHVYEGDDLFALIDQASVQLRRDLGIPARHIEESADVPVEEIMTASVDALRHFSEGTRAIRVDSDYDRALASLDEALAIDPTFATAHLARYQALLLRGDAAGAASAVQQAVEYSYRLPERLQYAAKAEWFAMQQDFPRSFAVYEMWAELYPQDIQAQLSAAQMRLFQDDRRGAIEKFEKVLDLDPTQVELLQRVGSLYEALGEPERARSYYERYAEANPEDKASFASLAGLSRRLGEHEAAREYYERALLLEPGDVELMLEVASLDRDLGAFDDAARGYEGALAAARTPQQRFEALRALSSFHEYRGSYRQAVEYLEQALAEGAAFQPPLAQIQLRLLTLDTYVHAGQPDGALQMLASLEPQLPPPLDALVPIGRIAIYEALERSAELEAAVTAAKEMLERLQLNMLRQPVIWGQGRLHELRGEWRDAIAAYEEERAHDPTDPTIPAQLGRCYRELGELERAESLILETLAARPSHARSHLELARVYERMDRTDDAIRHVERALETWAPADQEYGPAREAREMLERLRESGSVS